MRMRLPLSARNTDGFLSLTRFIALLFCGCAVRILKWRVCPVSLLFSRGTADGSVRRGVFCSKGSARASAEREPLQPLKR